MDDGASRWAGAGVSQAKAVRRDQQMRAHTAMTSRIYLKEA